MHVSLRICLGGTQKNSLALNHGSYFAKVEMSAKASRGRKPVITTCLRRSAKQRLTSGDTLDSIYGPINQQNQLRSIEDV